MMITVKVRPGAREDMFMQDGAFYVAKVKAQPQDNAANDALIRLIADYFHVPQSYARIVRGSRGRTKVVAVDA